MSLTTLLVVGVVIVVVVARRLYGEPLRARQLLIAPLAELAIGGYQLLHHGLAPREWVALVVSGLVSVAFGAARGATLHLFERNGYLYQRYRPITFAVWAGAFVARFVIRLAATGFAVPTGLHGMSGAEIGTMLITSGLGFLGESLVLVPRAMATGVPLAPSTGTRLGDRMQWR